MSFWKNTAVGTKDKSYDIGVYQSTKTKDFKDSKRSTPGEVLVSEPLPRPTVNPEQSRAQLNKILNQDKYGIDHATFTNGSQLATQMRNPAPDSHHATVDNDFRRINNPVETAARTALKDDIAAAVGNSGNAELDSARRVTLSGYLASATSPNKAGRDPAVARQILSCLREMDLPQLVRGTGAMPPGHSVAAQRGAWRLAYKLGSAGSSDYGILQAITQHPIATGDKRRLKNVLNSCHQMVEREHNGVLRTPAELERLAEHADTVIGNAVRADLKILRHQGDQFAWDAVILQRPENWKLGVASNLVRSGHYEKPVRSEVAQAAARTDKAINVWPERAVKEYNKDSSLEEVGKPWYKNVDRIKKKFAKLGMSTVRMFVPGLKKNVMGGMIENMDITNLALVNTLDESKKIELVMDQLKEAHLDLTAQLLRPRTEKEIRDRQGPANTPRDTVMAEMAAETRTQLATILPKIAMIEAMRKQRGLMQDARGLPLTHPEKEQIRARLNEFASADSDEELAEMLGLDQRKAPDGETFNGVREAINGVLQRQRSARVDPTPHAEDKGVRLNGIRPDAATLLNRFDEINDEVPGSFHLIPEHVDTWKTEVRNALRAVRGTDPTTAANSTEWTADWPSMEAAFHRWQGEKPDIELPPYMEKEDVHHLLLQMWDPDGGLELGSKISSMAGWSVGLDSKNRLTAAFVPGAKGVTDAEHDEPDVSESGSSIIEAIDTALEVASETASAAVNAAASKFVVVPGGKFVAQGGKEAVFSMELSAPALQMNMGTQMKGSVEIDFGARIGPNFSFKLKGNGEDNDTDSDENSGAHSVPSWLVKILGHKFSLMIGGRVGIDFKYEETRPLEMVIVRMGRNGYNREGEPGAPASIAAGINGDKDRRKQWTAMVNRATSPITDEERANGITSHLDKMLLASDDVSLTIQKFFDAKERKIKGKIPIDVGAFVARDEGRFGPSLTLLNTEGTYQRENWNTVVERQGAVRLYKETGVMAIKAGSGGSLVGSVVEEYLDSHPERNIGVGSDELSFSRDWASNLVVVRRTAVEEDGDIKPNSPMQYTHQTPGSFAHSLEMRFDDWVKSELTRRLGAIPAEHRPDVPPEGADTTTPEYQRDYARYENFKKDVEGGILLYIKQLKDEHKLMSEGGPHPNKTYHEWYQLKAPKADEINRYRAAARSAYHQGNNTEAQKLDDIAMKLFHDPQSWGTVLSFSTNERNKSTAVQLPNVGYVSKSIKSVAATTLETIST